MPRSRLAFLRPLVALPILASLALVPLACARGSNVGELTGGGGDGVGGATVQGPSTTSSGSFPSANSTTTSGGFPSANSTTTTTGGFPSANSTTTTGGFPSANSTTTTGGFPSANSTTTTGSPATTTTGGSSSCDNTGTCSTCATCSQNSVCANEWLACDNDPTLDCLFYQFCIQGCAPTDTVCFNDCGAQYPLGEQLFGNYAYCAVCMACYNDCDGAGSGC